MSGVVTITIRERERDKKKEFQNPFIFQYNFSYPLFLPIVHRHYPKYLISIVASFHLAVVEEGYNTQRISQGLAKPLPSPAKALVHILASVTKMLADAKIL